ncbi:Rcs stress response system protein RcsF [Candidatus Colwellia aromaticivorans]|uniref:Rcs stress response system protein RcsF n=1 Tax=Candidatus Colwellia aromaticivorans TaxID=2267621 RepID=UPI000DF22036|nr:Rcs stress response system protein RcsF [Candidatus Colwellia aromaticivorans]
MNTKTFIIPFIVLTTMALISSCNSSHISTNLDKENFSDYFSASKVKIYKQEKDIKTHHNYIGVVEGQDCQVKPHHAVPDEINARTQARRQAFEQQGNAVIFTGCALLTSEQLVKLNNSSDAQQCHAIVICYAKAFAIELPAKK